MHKTMVIIICLFTSMITGENLFAANMQEKPLIIRGLSLGMDAIEAKNTLDKVLNNGWKAGSIDSIYNLIQGYRPGLYRWRRGNFR